MIMSEARDILNIVDIQCHHCNKHIAYLAKEKLSYYRKFYDAGAFKCTLTLALCSHCTDTNEFNSLFSKFYAVESTDYILLYDYKYCVADF